MLSEPYKNINNETQKKIKSPSSLRDRYTQCLKDQGIPQNRIKWYLSWIEQFARGSHVPVEMRSPEDVEQFLRGLSQRPNLQDWQYTQVIDALRILYLVLLQRPWATKWSWNQDLMAQSRLASKGAEGDFLDAKAQISDVLSELVDKMRTEIRVRYYSIRTEEAYIEWVCRYAKFLRPGHIQAARGKRGQKLPRVFG